MRKYNKILLLASLVISVACNSNSSADLSPEAAVTAFSLGTFNVLHNDITVSGKDTMVITQMTNGVFKYNIDNVRGLIFNTDTLPFGSVINSVTTNVTATGTTYFYIPDSNGVYYNALWTSSLETDLDKIEKITVLSDDGSYRREYMFMTNVYDANPDSMKWEGLAMLPDCIIPVNAVECDGKMTVFGFDENSSPCATQYSDDDSEWSTPAECSGLTDNVIFGSLSIHDGIFVLVDGGIVRISTDCVNWNAASSETDTGIATLIPFRQTGDYGTAWAVTDDGWLASSSDLKQWSKIQMIPDNFPVNNISGICCRLATNSDILRYTIVGTDSWDNEALIWTKLSTERTWARIIPAEDHNLKCPASDNLAMIRYDGRLYSFGGSMDSFFESRDNGITWRECNPLSETYSSWNNYMQIPAAYKGISLPFCYAVDSANAIWLVSSDSRGVWRGYINRLHR